MKWILLLSSILLPTCLFAATPHTPSDGHLVFNMLCTILVIFMALPGLVLFYGGMVQRKNVLSIFAQCIAMASIVSLVWLVVGYQVAFHSLHWSDGILGVFSFLSFSHLAFHLPTAATVQNLLNMIYQMGFAAIAVVIVIGGFAERMRFSASVIFAPLWLLFVYCPIAHWIWGGGWLDKLGALDFAGGAVVHVNAGVAGLVAALMLKERYKVHSQPNSLILVTIGTSILWIGWFGFNAGSATSLLTAVLALVNTHVAATAAALAWMAAEWVKHGKPSARSLLFGGIAGLVAITPAAGYCTPIIAVLIGLVAGSVCFWLSELKYRLNYDDALDAFGLHGIAGIIGALLTGVVAVSVHPWYTQLGIQALSLIVTIAWSALWTFIILWCIQKWHGLRVSPQAELEGLDAHEHGEQLPY